MFFREPGSAGDVIPRAPDDSTARSAAGSVAPGFSRGKAISKVDARRSAAQDPVSDRFAERFLHRYAVRITEMCVAPPQLKLWTTGPPPLRGVRRRPYVTC